MARNKKILGKTLDIAYLISTGILSRCCPRSLIADQLKRANKSSQRRRIFPAEAVVYFIMAMALWREASIEEVARVVCEGLSWLNEEKMKVSIPGKAAISQARSRLGSEVMSRLAAEVLRPLAKPESAGSWYRGLRLMAVDGTNLDVADEKANADYFGRPSCASGETAFPQMRVLSLIECGTHVVTAAELGTYRCSEQQLASQLFPGRLTAEMLLLADRNFYGFKLWRLAGSDGGKLLWRVKSSLTLPIEQRLADGSYLSTVYHGDDRRRVDGERVRVIEYKLGAGKKVEPEVYRLITNILDCEKAPAEELAALYHERWEVENVFGEIKTQLYGYKTILRSKTPDLVKQEMWGLLMAHFAIRQLMNEAAERHSLDPDRLSFIKAVRVIKRKLPQAAAIPP